MTIENMRKKAGLSQEALAEMLGVTQGAVSQWEVGLSAPTASKLPELAKALHCDIADLFGKEE